MAGLDLTGLIPGLEQMLLLDTVRVTAPAITSPVLDDSTGQLTQPTGGPVYEGDGCILPVGNRPPESAPYALKAYMDNPRSVFRLLTPVSAALVPRDAIVEVLRSARDDALVGPAWRALDASVPASQIVLRETWLQLQKRAGA